jgi:cytochrome P450
VRVPRVLFRRRWKRLIGSIIAMRRKAGSAGSPRDLFDLLSQAHGADNQDLLVDEVSTMIVAGHETTALTLFWMCTLLSQAPKWQAALAEEASEHDLSADATASDPNKLVLARAVVQETLRLYSPGFMAGRLANKSHEVCGTQVPQGSLVLIPYWLLHRSPRLWPRPAEFDPSRFLRGSDPDRFTYLPFGVGRHVCIGAQLAMSESTLVIARLMRQFSISLLDERPVLPVARLTTRPDFAPKFVLQARRIPKEA